MPKPSTVQEPEPLLAYLFTTWPEEKKKQIRTWLKFQTVTMKGRSVSQFDHSLKRGDVMAIRPDRFSAQKSKLGGGMNGSRSGLSVRVQSASPVQPSPSVNV